MDTQPFEFPTTKMEAAPEGLPSLDTVIALLLDRCDTCAAVTLRMLGSM